jgi:hypothetical protein
MNIRHTKAPIRTIDDRALWYAAALLVSAMLTAAGAGAVGLFLFVPLAGAAELGLRLIHKHSDSCQRQW